MNVVMRNIENTSTKEKMGRMGSLNRLLGKCPSTKFDRIHNEPGL